MKQEARRELQGDKIQVQILVRVLIDPPIISEFPNNKIIGRYEKN